MDKKKRVLHRRTGVQAVWTFLSNCYAVGFVEGKIYTGPLKKICFPGLNCYSCPGAVGSCPIGSLQAVMGSWKFHASLYVGGFLMVVGAVLGRFVCGWLCPFGLVQDLCHKVPFLKKIKHFPGDRVLRYLKYGILAVFVLLMPLFVVDMVGQGSPAFCQYICPAGTLSGGIPLVLGNAGLRGAIGFLFQWKMAILAATLLAAVIVYRPFCKYLCPLGAVYALFNRASLYRLRVDTDKCIHCGACSKACKMGVDPVKAPGSPECIRCGDCAKACPKDAIQIGFTASKGCTAQQKRP